MTLQGKGFYIWKIPDVENGSASAIAAEAEKAKLSHVLIKIADGKNGYNIDLTTGIDQVPPVTSALRAKGIQVWGWHYVYGYDPIAEADKAIQRLLELKLDGYVVDAEAEYKEPGKATAATRFMTRLRSAFPNLPIALSSYRYPSYHPQLPWKEFLEHCDYNMPQVYWMLNDNPGEQLTRSVREFQALTPFRPIIPTGAAFKQSGWVPTPEQVSEFLETALALNLSAANFWEWANCRTYLPAVWDTIKNYKWAVEPPPPDMAQSFIEALNSGDPDRVITLYRQNAVHVTYQRTIQGLANLRSYYQSFLTQTLPKAAFTLTGFSGTGSTRNFTWTATSGAGKVLNGNDTLALMDGLIAYHYSFFTIVK